MCCHRQVTSGGEAATHRSHRGDDFEADYIWLYSPTTSTGKSGGALGDWGGGWEAHEFGNRWFPATAAWHQAHAASREESWATLQVTAWVPLVDTTAKKLYEPATRAAYNGNLAQYLVDLHDARATFDFCGGMMFQLVLSPALRRHLAHVCACVRRLATAGRHAWVLGGGALGLPAVRLWRPRLHLPRRCGPAGRALRLASLR